MRLPARMYRILAAGAAVALLTLAIAACGGVDGDDEDSAAPAAPAATQAAATEAAAAAYEAEAEATAAPSRSRPAQPAATAAAAQEAAADSGSCANCATARQQGSTNTTQAAASVSEPPSQRPSPGATTFQNYGRTPYVKTSMDAVSTFSLDTDRTSYFLALAWAQSGYAVEPDSVRAEEWVNAFSYDYDQPRDDRSFAITSDVVQHPLGEGRHLVRVAFQAPHVRDDVPLNVTLVLDASGSMSSGNRVAIAREAAEAIRNSLGSDDRIAVVHFTTDVIDWYTVEHSRPGDEDVAWSIGQLAPHNSTNVQAGLDLGVRLADEARRERPDAYNYVILMSDGVANVDATNPFAILDSSPDTDHRNPLRLITIGVGIENYNDYLLEQLAQHGNGWYRYLDTTEQARETFSRENWLALSTPFADQARAQVTWDPALVSSWRIVGYENRVTPDHTFEQNRREFADLPSGAATTAFYEVVLHNETRRGLATLGEVEVRWVDPRSGDTYSQAALLEGRTDAPFDAGDQHLRFGAIVALASDRYSALSVQLEGAKIDIGGLGADMTALRAELDSLYERMSTLQSYHDFSFLLERMTARVEELGGGSSGYSQ
ncbi:MAG: von Willebrand factor type A domain-containing protein [Chloroflexota bacterium]|nr:von Willebrand factor type A domain-containing protein [Chloroflexota bacterium]